MVKECIRHLWNILKQGGKIKSRQEAYIKGKCIFYCFYLSTALIITYGYLLVFWCVCSLNHGVQEGLFSFLLRHSLWVGILTFCLSMGYWMMQKKEIDTALIILENPTDKNFS